MPYITMKKLGHWGRFANQLFEYAFLHIYAEEHGLEVQIPPWIGEHLFGLKDSRITVDLPERGEPRDDSKHSPVDPPKGDEYVDRDFLGFAQFHSSWYAPHAEKIREWFSPTPEIGSRLFPAVQALDERGKTKIGIHLRRGDYGQGYFYTTPLKWCLKWLDEHWHGLDDPCLFLATEDPLLVDQLNPYPALLVEDLGVTLSPEPYPHFIYLDEDLRQPTPRKMDFYPEFYLLTQCDVILISNSSFSFFAAMLADPLSEAWRPSIPARGFIEFDPWNDHVLLHDYVEANPQIPGLKGSRRPSYGPRGKF